MRRRWRQEARRRRSSSSSVSEKKLKDARRSASTHSRGKTFTLTFPRVEGESNQKKTFVLTFPRVEGEHGPLPTHERQKMRALFLDLRGCQLLSVTLSHEAAALFPYHRLELQGRIWGLGFGVWDLGFRVQGSRRIIFPLPALRAAGPASTTGPP